MLKAVSDVDRSLAVQKIGDSEPAPQDEVELAALFRNIPCEISPKGAPGKFGIGPDPIKCGEAVFDLRSETDAVRLNRFLKLDIDHLAAEGYLPSVPTVPDGIGERDHPGGHEDRSPLLGFAFSLYQAMGEQVSYREPNLLSTNGDPGGITSSVQGGSHHERPKNPCTNDPSKIWHAKSTSISCRLFHGKVATGATSQEYQERVSSVHKRNSFGKNARILTTGHGGGER